MRVKSSLPGLCGHLYQQDDSLRFFSFGLYWVARMLR